MHTFQAAQVLLFHLSLREINLVTARFVVLGALLHCCILYYCYHERPILRIARLLWGREGTIILLCCGLIVWKEKEKEKTEKTEKTEKSEKSEKSEKKAEKTDTKKKK